MRHRLLLLTLLLALPGLQCAEATYDEGDVPGVGDGGKKDDAAPSDDLGEKDASIPTEDLGGGDDVVAPSSDVVMSDDLGVDAGIESDVVGVDVVVADSGSPDVGAIDTGVIDTGVVDTGVRDTGVVDTGVVDTGVVDTGVVVDTGTTFPPILCPLLGTPIPITCRSRNGLRPCCGIGGACFCEQSSPFGPLCLPCS
jgi:hypothetical protein